MSDEAAFHVSVGDVVAGKYLVEHELGRGGMAVVLAARHVELDERFALKFLAPELVAQPAIATRFAREAKAACRIRSEHVARVHDVGSHDGVPFLVMEHLSGRDLGALLSEHGALPIDEAVEYVMQACEALAAAHAQGIVHRDIKPENLFVTSSDGRMLLKVVDFGVAELVGSVDRDGPMVGTIDYLAPEVVLGERAPSVQSDLFAVGVVAYQALSGATPFRGGNVGQLVLAHATTTPKSLHAFDARIPPEVDAWMERALARRPEARFESAREMAAAFERAVAVVNVKATGVLPRFDSRALRRPETSRYVIVAPRDGKEK